MSHHSESMPSHGQFIPFLFMNDDPPSNSISKITTTTIFLREKATTMLAKEFTSFYEGPT